MYNVRPLFQAVSFEHDAKLLSIVIDDDDDDDCRWLVNVAVAEDECNSARLWTDLKNWFKPRANAYTESNIIAEEAWNKNGGMNR